MIRIEVALLGDLYQLQQQVLSVTIFNKLREIKKSSNGTCNFTEYYEIFTSLYYGLLGTGGGRAGNAGDGRTGAGLLKQNKNDVINDNRRVSMALGKYPKHF
jgi:hypothetical protein